MNGGGVSDMNAGPDDDLWEEDMEERPDWRGMILLNNPQGHIPSRAELARAEGTHTARLPTTEELLVAFENAFADYKPPAKPRSREFDVNCNHLTLRGPRGIIWCSSTDDPVWTTHRNPRSFAGRGQLRMTFERRLSFIRMKLRETSFWPQLCPPQKA